jgi:hypothetical protein
MQNFTWILKKFVKFFLKEETKPGKCGNFVEILADDKAEESSGSIFFKRFSNYVQLQSLFSPRLRAEKTIL